MKNRMLRTVLFIGLFVSISVVAREYRTPLSIEDGPMHRPVERGNGEQWDRWNSSSFDEKKWFYEVWAVGYTQRAHQEYGHCDCPSKVPLTELFFDRSSFLGKDIFASSTVSSPASPYAPFLSTVTLAPRFNYEEQGVVLSMWITRNFKENWCAGVRGVIPYRDIEIENELANGSMLGQIETSIDSFRVRRSDRFDPDDTDGVHDGTIDNDWAYRLDFLSTLVYSVDEDDPDGDGVPPYQKLVVFKDINGDITIAGRDVTDANANPVSVIQIVPGTFPTGVLGLYKTRVDTLPFLDAAGTGPGYGNRARFQQNPPTDYTSLGSNPAAQSKFWVVPTIVPTGPTTLSQAADAVTIQNKIEDLIKNINTSSTTLIDFFNSKGISFDTYHTKGFGDLDTEVFVGYSYKDFAYFEGQLGIRWPTGKREENPNIVLSQIARGNNGHFELKLGGYTWYWPINWFMLTSELSYHEVFTAHERVAASFKGATVKNINLPVDADISWRYVIWRLTTSFLHPKDATIGFDIGYELYWKSCDHICFLACPESCSNSCSADSCAAVSVNCDTASVSCNEGCNNCSDGSCSGPCYPSARNVCLSAASNGCTALDLLGNRQPLDPNVLARDTQRIGHKFRLEFFKHWNFGQLYAGWNQVFAGKNIMQESEWHLGMQVWF